MIKNSSASALTWFTAILLGIGLLMMSPAGSFAVFVLAALFGAAPALFGTKKIRIAAIILLLAAIILAASQYPEFQNERDAVRKRSKISQMKSISSPGYSYGNFAVYYRQTLHFFPHRESKER